jgi:histidine triad (HIT) family protein
MPSIFTKIIQGEIPSYKIAENELYYAFLDIQPMAPGHTLVVPKKEVDYIFDLDEELLSGLLPFARPIARAIEKVVPCERIGLSVIGVEVPHTHLHLIPLRTMDDINFSKPKMRIGEDEMKRLASEIRSNL